jgi:type IV secretion system protein TrbH
MPILSHLGRVLAALLLGFVLAACQTLGGTGLITSTVTGRLSPDAASTIAADMVGLFAERVSPGSTTIGLTADGSVFGQVLEASLRGAGYAIATDQQTKASATVPLAYVVDDFEEGVLVRLSTTAVDITRMFKLTPTGAEPVSPVSVFQRGTGEPS